MTDRSTAHAAHGRFSRLEDGVLLRGKGQFIDDIKLPDMLHATFVRSSHAHAILRSVDAEEARELAGVRAIFTYSDLRPIMTGDRIGLALPSGYVRFHVDPFVLVKDEATYVGEPIALVIAESRRVAEDAANLVIVDLEPLPAVVDIDKAAVAGSTKARLDVPDNIVARTMVKYGDTAAAFAKATHVVKERFFLHKGGGHSIEGRGIVAHYNRASELLTLWNSTQMPHRCKTILIDTLALSEQQVRVIAPDVGGGFGPKAVFHPEDLAIAAAAMLIDAPIKWVEDRFENFVAAVAERDQSYDLEMAADADGRLLGFRGVIRHDHGSCTPYGFAIPYNSATNAVGNYVLPSMEIDVIWCLTNKVPTAATRGAGRPQGTFVMERMLDLIARRVGIDGAEVRMRNLITAKQMPYSVPLKMRDGSFMTYDSGDYPECQRRAILAADWEGFPARRAASKKNGRLRGIGLGNYVELTGRGPFESVTVRVGPSGKIMVSTGATAQGQSTKTTLAQLVADILHVDIERIHVSCGDTSTSLLGAGAFASRQTVTAGNSAIEAAQLVAQKALDVAAVLMEASAADLEIVDGGVSLKGVPGVRKELGDLARAVNGSLGFPMPGGLPPGLFATSNFQVQGTPFSNGTHICEVEVDPETGHVKIERYTVVHDCGKVLNSTVVDGQVQGGVVHGIGATLFEWMQFDEFGQPLTVTYADYLLPSSDVVPRIDVHHMESPSPLNPLGVKGAGEGGTIGAPAAIVSAIDNALQPLNIDIRELPLTPARLYAAIREAERALRENSL